MPANVPLEAEAVAADADELVIVPVPAIVPSDAVPPCSWSTLPPPTFHVARLLPADPLVSRRLRLPLAPFKATVPANAELSPDHSIHRAVAWFLTLSVPAPVNGPENVVVAVPVFDSSQFVLPDTAMPPVNWVA